MVQPGAKSVAAWCDRLLDAVVVLLATWTVVYHVCLVARLGVAPAIAIEVVAVAGWVLLRGRLAGREAGPADTRGVTGDGSADLTGRLRSPWVLTTLGAAGVAAVATAVSAPWVLVWVPWLVAAGAGTCWAAGRIRRDRVPAGAAPSDPDPGGRWTTAVVLAWTVGLAVLAMWTLRPNPDDLFYLNLSQWVADHGTFPIRDTLFANLVYPMSNWPPVASYDGLVGAAAHVTSSAAGSVEYMVVPPLATALAVLALWRLLRAWGVRQVATVLSVALVFLLLDGSGSYGSPGNLFLTRLWQGKVILLCVLVPLLLTYALRYVERPNRLRLLWLATGGAAAVGLSTTGIFLVPVLAVAGMAPLVLVSWRKALAGFVALAAYPLAAGVVTTALGGRSADDFGARRQYRFDGSWIGHEIFLTGLVALVGVAAVLLGVLLVPHRAGRITTGLLALVTGVVVIPGLTRAAYDLTGLGPTLWRLSWGCTVAALVGIAAVRAAGLLPGRRTVAAVAAVALGLMVVFGDPIFAGATGTRWAAPFHWQRSHSSLAVAARVVGNTPPGGIVLAPDSLAITVAVTSTSVKTVAPRDYYMYYLRNDPRFHYPERIALVYFVNHVGGWHQAEITRALRVVGVHIACVARPDVRRFAVLERAGMKPLFTSAYYRCLQMS